MIFGFEPRPGNCLPVLSAALSPMKGIEKLT